jgi:hypothetical protein
VNALGIGIDWKQREGGEEEYEPACVGEHWNVPPMKNSMAHAKIVATWQVSQ